MLKSTFNRDPEKAAGELTLTPFVVPHSCGFESRNETEKPHECGTTNVLQQSMATCESCYVSNNFRRERFSDIRLSH